MKDKCELNIVWFEMGIQCYPGSQHSRMPPLSGKYDRTLETTILAITYHHALGGGE